MKKKILVSVAFLVVLIVVLYFVLTWNAPKVEFSPETYQPPAGTMNCLYDAGCLKEAVASGEQAVAFVEEEPTPYTYYELVQYEKKGTTPPEKEGPLFSHTVKSCENDVCDVHIRMERLPSPLEIPEWVISIALANPEMDCDVPLDQLGTIPDDMELCSGPFVDAAKQIDEEAERRRQQQ